MSEKKNEDYLAVAPPKRSGWESFKLFIWNGETSEFLGRSASSWGKLSSVLISHFFFCLLRMVRSCTLRSDSGKIGDERGQTQWLTTFDPVQTYTRNQTKGAGLTRTRSKINTLVVRGTYMKEEKKTWGSFLLGQKISKGFEKRLFHTTSKPLATVRAIQNKFRSWSFHFHS